MRSPYRHKRRGLWLIFFVALVVAGREVPEYVTLTDDTSNDGIVVSSDHQVVPHAPLRSPQFGEKLGFASERSAFGHTFGFSPSFLPVGLKAGRELLLLLTLQRK